MQTRASPAIVSFHGTRPAGGFASGDIASSGEMRVAFHAGKMLAASDKYRDEATAVWHANHFAIFKFGRNRHGGVSIGIMTETFAGAGGARSFADGVDIGGEIPNPISRMANVETMEATFPLRYLFRRRRIDSGGPGEYRGGLGMEIAVTPHDAPDDSSMDSNDDADNSAADDSSADDSSADDSSADDSSSDDSGGEE